MFPIVLSFSSKCSARGSWFQRTRGINEGGREDVPCADIQTYKEKMEFVTEQLWSGFDDTSKFGFPFLSSRPRKTGKMDGTVSSIAGSRSRCYSPPQRGPAPPRFPEDSAEQLDEEEEDAHPSASSLLSEASNCSPSRAHASSGNDNLEGGRNSGAIPSLISEEKGPASAMLHAASANDQDPITIPGNNSIPSRSLKTKRDLLSHQVPSCTSPRSLLARIRAGERMASEPPPGGSTDKPKAIRLKIVYVLGIGAANVFPYAEDLFTLRISRTLGIHLAQEVAHKLKAEEDDILLFRDKMETDKDVEDINYGKVPIADDEDVSVLALKKMKTVYVSCKDWKLAWIDYALRASDSTFADGLAHQCRNLAGYLKSIYRIFNMFPCHTRAIHEDEGQGWTGLGALQWEDVNPNEDPHIKSDRDFWPRLSTPDFVALEGWEYGHHSFISDQADAIGMLEHIARVMSHEKLSASLSRLECRALLKAVFKLQCMAWDLHEILEFTAASQSSENIFLPRSWELQGQKYPLENYFLPVYRGCLETKDLCSRRCDLGIGKLDLKKRMSFNHHVFQERLQDAQLLSRKILLRVKLMGGSGNGMYGRPNTSLLLWGCVPVCQAIPRSLALSEDSRPPVVQELLHNEWGQLVFFGPGDDQSTLFPEDEDADCAVPVVYRGGSDVGENLLPRQVIGIMPYTTVNPSAWSHGGNHDPCCPEAGPGAGNTTTTADTLPQTASTTTTPAPVSAADPGTLPQGSDTTQSTTPNAETLRVPRQTKNHLLVDNEADLYLEQGIQLAKVVLVIGAWLSASSIVSFLVNFVVRRTLLVNASEPARGDSA